MRPALWALMALSVLAVAKPACAQQIDWQALARVQVIEVITHDGNGDVRETKVWFTLIDGGAYLRTSGSRWLSNIRREPEVVVRIEGSEYNQLAEVVTAPDIIEKVDAASLEKYGVQDRFIRFFRMSEPDILRLHPPEPASTE